MKKNYIKPQMKVYDFPASNLLLTMSTNLNNDSLEEIDEDGII